MKTVDETPGTFINVPTEPREIEPPPELVAQFPGALKLRAWLMGECSIIYTREPYGLKAIERLSISNPKRYPTWDEIKFAHYRLLSHDKTFGMLLPPPEHYCDVGGHVMQVIEILGDQALEN